MHVDLVVAHRGEPMTIASAWPASYDDPWDVRTSLTLDLDDVAVEGLMEALGRRRHGSPPRALPDALGCLTDRELTVLRAMATGASNAEIATELFVSVATVKTHVARVLSKLGLRDRVQAVVFAYESRLVVPR
jgi:DNA-binding NarL/FixJ family response regulator